MGLARRASQCPKRCRCPGACRTRPRRRMALPPRNKPQCRGSVVLATGAGTCTASQHRRGQALLGVHDEAAFPPPGGRSWRRHPQKVSPLQPLHSPPEGGGTAAAPAGARMKKCPTASEHLPQAGFARANAAATSNAAPPALHEAGTGERAAPDAHRARGSTNEVTRRGHQNSPAGGLRPRAGRPRPPRPRLPPCTRPAPGSVPRSGTRKQPTCRAAAPAGARMKECGAASEHLPQAGFARANAAATSNAAPPALHEAGTGERAAQRHRATAVCRAAAPAHDAHRARGSTNGVTRRGHHAPPGGGLRPRPRGHAPHARASRPARGRHRGACRARRPSRPREHERSHSARPPETSRRRASPAPGRPRPPRPRLPPCTRPARGSVPRSGTQI